MTFEKPRILTDSEASTIRGKCLMNDHPLKRCLPPADEFPSIKEQVAELKAAGWIPLTPKCWKAPVGSGCAGVFLGPHGAWKAMRRRAQ